MNKLVSTLILFLYVSVSFAQSELDAYKYIIVPKEYDFLKEEDKYRLNSLTKFLFEKQGFETLSEGENYPNDLTSNPCLGLTVAVKDHSNMFTSKLDIELSNCFNNVVYISERGYSKEKDYKKSYQQALRSAFVSIAGLNYAFNESLVVNNQVGTSLNKPVSTPPVAAVVSATPVVKEEPMKGSDVKAAPVAKSYRNSNISFFLIEQNGNFLAYVKESNASAYRVGEKIGTLSKTSRPDTYRIAWKGNDGKMHQTTGYFDPSGNLHIDIEKEGKIEVVHFQVEK